MKSVRDCGSVLEISHRGRLEVSETENISMQSSDQYIITFKTL